MSSGAERRAHAMVHGGGFLGIRGELQVKAENRLAVRQQAEPQLACSACGACLACSACVAGS